MENCQIKLIDLERESDKCILEDDFYHTKEITN